MTSTAKPVFIHAIPITMVRDASEFREAISTLYGDDWVSTEQRGSDFAVIVNRAIPRDLKKKLQEDKILRSDGETAEFEERLWREEGNGRTAING
ncbi:hypothetical protein CDV31_008779 [Fusarium ambrosium]|uniref:Uncharacterized protein n=1 Tax=Fusarium ambrosium TaxID=131363 RepID=A0A428TYJ9_9HYPO|nr:hypothetical protein CDV31_008779 [Fusarium ambrosium]